MPVTPWLLLVLVCVTTARATRLVVADAFPLVAVTRRRVLNRYSPNSWQAYLAQCPWCMGVWIAAPIVAVADWRYNVPAPLMYWATAAWAAGFLNGLEIHDTDEEG